MLIPGRIVREANALNDADARLEHILLWIDTYQSDYYFKPGESIYHKDNLEQEMFVDRIIKKNFSNNGHDSTRMVGIEAHWWENQMSEELT